MGFGNTPSREWDRDLKTIQNKSEHVAMRLLFLPKLLPTEDHSALCELRFKLFDANVNWMTQCNRWNAEWIRFFWEDSCDPEAEASGFTLYDVWLRYAKECDDKGEPPCVQWDEEPCESTKHDSIITPPEKFFRLDTEIVQLLGEVHTLAMGVLNKLYKGRVDALLTYYLTNSCYDPEGELAIQRDTALDWIRNGIETLLQATDRALARDVVDVDGGKLGAKQPIVFAKASSGSADEPSELGCKEQTARSNWPTDPPPDGFCYGPVEGQIKDFVLWLEADRATLANNNGKGGFYIRREHRTKYQAWFKELRRFSKINQQVVAKRDAKAAQTGPNGTKRDQR